MDSDHSELSASEFLSAGSGAESHASSHSSNFAATWPETHVQTWRFLQDAQLATRKFQLERYGTELEASVLEKELELQTEIREANSIINDLRIGIANQETELSHIQEKRNARILEVRRRLVRRLQRYDAAMRETDGAIAQMGEAIRRQRAAHQQKRAELEGQWAEQAGGLDGAIAALNRDIDEVRRLRQEAVQKGETDAMETQAAIEFMESEIKEIAAESDRLDATFDQLGENMTALRRELVVAEEEAAQVRGQLHVNARLRAQMKGVVDRTVRRQWEATTRSFLVLE
jgi:chromosome segregation ATPase